MNRLQTALLLFVGLGNPPLAAAQTTQTFRQDEGGYTGNVAANISTLSQGASNGYNGTTFTDGVDWCIGDLPAQSYNISPLIRFEGLGIPAGATVISASLRITFISWDGGQQIIGRYLKVPWSGTSSSDGTGVGWMRRDTGLPWAAPGARGEGTDLHAGKTFAYTQIHGNGRQSHVTTLDRDVVQGWIDNPASNHGVQLRVDLDDRHTGVVPPLHGTLTERPLLSITYTLSAGPTPTAPPATPTQTAILPTPTATQPSGATSTPTLPQQASPTRTPSTVPPTVPPVDTPTPGPPPVTSSGSAGTGAVGALLAALAVWTFRARRQVRSRACGCD